MNWNELFATTRLGSEGVNSTMHDRSAFQRDFDRIAFSTAFRRMQGKTQVFPLPESDLTHTRLTHSIEVACVARSLGQLAGRELENCDIDSGEFAGVAASAALAHDLGNPPFGHSGETAISEYFLREGKTFLTGMTKQQSADLVRFEGNALGFRMLVRTKPKQSEWPGGLQLTYAVLGAFSKYPCSSETVPDASRASTKKFGFFSSETDVFARVATELGLGKPRVGWYRHPLAFLVEAADDICYRIIDLEDGYRLQLVPYDRAEDLLRHLAEMIPSPINESTLAGIRDPDARIGYLRAKAINNLVAQTAEVFRARQNELLSGSFDRPLIEETRAFAGMCAIKDATKKLIYSYRPVLEIEAAGFTVLAGLLHEFLSAAFEHPRSARAEKVLSLVGPEYLPDTHDQYDTVMGVTEFVANMTDDFAISRYRSLRGIELPRT